MPICILPFMPNHLATAGWLLPHRPFALRLPRQLTAGLRSRCSPPRSSAATGSRRPPPPAPFPPSAAHPYCPPWTMTWQRCVPRGWTARPSLGCSPWARRWARCRHGGCSRRWVWEAVEGQGEATLFGVLHYRIMQCGWCGAALLLMCVSRDALTPTGGLPYSAVVVLARQYTCL